MATPKFPSKPRAPRNWAKEGANRNFDKNRERARERARWLAERGLKRNPAGKHLGHANSGGRKLGKSIGLVDATANLKDQGPTKRRKTRNV